MDKTHRENLKLSPEYNPTSQKIDYSIKHGKYDKETEKVAREMMKTHQKELIRSKPNVNFPDSFLQNYDEIDEEVTLTLLEYLHKNPHLFRKIRFLQKRNKAINSSNLPELEKLRIIEGKVVSPHSPHL